MPFKRQPHAIPRRAHGTDPTFNPRPHGAAHSRCHFTGSGVRSFGPASLAKCSNHGAPTGFEASQVAPVDPGIDNAGHLDLVPGGNRLRVLDLKIDRPRPVLQERHPVTRFIIGQQPLQDTGLLAGEFRIRHLQRLADRARHRLRTQIPRAGKQQQGDHQSADHLADPMRPTHPSSKPETSLDPLP